MADRPMPQPTAGRTMDPALRAEIARVCSSIPIDVGGSASLLKSLVLGDIIVTKKLVRIVEIGVYRGRLMLPLAVLMKALGRGEVVGIDPYTAADAVQTDDHQVAIDLKAWPATVAWDDIHDSVVEAIASNGLEDRARLIRSRSQDVAHDFAPGTIDLLHVDGNHDEAAVSRDVELYLPKISAGGFIVLDDVSWPSVRTAYDRLAAEHELVFELIDRPEFGFADDGWDDFAVFRLTA